MENICNRQNQIHIILTWIVRAINKALKKALNVWGLKYFFLCSGICYIELYGDLWSFFETSTKTQNPFLCLNLTHQEINKKDD